MQGKWVNLYNILKNIEEDFLDYQNRKNLLPIREQLNNIQEFAVWFLQKNPLGMDKEAFIQTKKEIIAILQDIVPAIEENDYVLMHDAITYGVMEYLKACNPELVEAE